MSYQFEDDSAMDELLAQQLDRHKKQPVSARPPTASAGTKPSPTATTTSQLRPSTASLGSTRQTGLAVDKLDASPSSLQDGDVAPPRGKLSTWLERDAASARQTRGESTFARQSITTNDDLVATRYPSPRSSVNPTAGQTVVRAFGHLKELDSLLDEPRLQEMSKQRLVQLILDQVVPAMGELRQAASQHSPAELERLAQELTLERNRLELVGMRHQEEIKLVEQKWAQLNGQLERRLEASETEIGRLIAAQREHLDRLDGQYQGNLTRLAENYEQRLQAELKRFDEILKQRDELHRLELDSKLNVNFDLTKLATIQTEWRRALESTIEQLNDQFKSIESLLDKQTLQVNGTNSELIKRTRQLCEQYDKYEESSEQLGKLAEQLAGLLPKFSTNQQESELVVRQACDKLAEFGRQSGELTRREETLTKLRDDVDKQRAELQADRLQLTLDASRVALKEERLDELIKSNGECEKNLNNQRISQIEEQAHLQTKRVHLDEKSNELREQNHSLHLLRKRLTSQKEELIKAQMELDRNRADLKSLRAQVEGESERLHGLRARAKREIDQMRRLQKSLVCSLCMSRLFDGDHNRAIELIAPTDSPAAAGELSTGSLGRLIGGGGDDGDRATKKNKSVAPLSVASRPDMAGSLRQQREQIEHHLGLVAAESKYIELLFQAN